MVQRDADSPRHLSSSEGDAYDELSAYTLMRGDATFMHQHVVDAFAVQYSDEQTKPIKLTFGLVGLYLKSKSSFQDEKCNWHT